MPERTSSVADYMDGGFDFTTGATSAYDLLVPDRPVAPNAYPNDGSSLSFEEREERFHARTGAEPASADRPGVALKEYMLASIAIRRSAEQLPVPLHLSNRGEDLADPTRLKPVPAPYIGSMSQPVFSRQPKSEPGYMLVDHMDDEVVSASPVRGYLTRDDFPGLYQRSKALTAASVIQSSQSERQAGSPVRVTRAAEARTPAYLRWTSSSETRQSKDGLRDTSLLMLAEMAREASEQAAANAPVLPLPEAVKPYENPFEGLYEDDADPTCIERPGIKQLIVEADTTASEDDEAFAGAQSLVDAQREELLRACDNTLPDAILFEEGASGQAVVEESRRKRLAFFRRVLRGLHNL